MLFLVISLLNQFDNNFIQTPYIWFFTIHKLRSKFLLNTYLKQTNHN
jgi:hypothetical protein